jgi:hypothetical protein
VTILAKLAFVAGVFETSKTDATNSTTKIRPPMPVQRCERFVTMLPDSLGISPFDLALPPHPGLSKTAPGFLHLSLVAACP